MARTLTAARAIVPAGREREYLDGIRRLATEARQRGARVWVFRNRAAPEAFLEFVESADDTAAARSTEEIAIERTLRDVATYGPDAEDLWEECAL